MEPSSFKYANKDLAKPSSMTDGECGSLPVYTDGKQCISLWRMSWGERFSALFFGRVWVAVFSGETQPPIYLVAEREHLKEVETR